MQSNEENSIEIQKAVRYGYVRDNLDLVLLKAVASKKLTKSQFLALIKEVFEIGISDITFNLHLKNLESSKKIQSEWQETLGSDNLRMGHPHKIYSITPDGKGYLEILENTSLDFSRMLARLDEITLPQKEDAISPSTIPTNKYDFSELPYSQLKLLSRKELKDKLNMAKADYDMLRNVLKHFHVLMLSGKTISEKANMMRVNEHTVKVYESARRNKFSSIVCDEEAPRPQSNIVVTPKKNPIYDLTFHPMEYWEKKTKRALMNELDITNREAYTLSRILRHYRTLTRTDMNDSEKVTSLGWAESVLKETLKIMQLFVLPPYEAKGELKTGKNVEVTEQNVGEYTVAKTSQKLQIASTTAEMPVVTTSTVYKKPEEPMTQFVPGNVVTDFHKIEKVSEIVANPRTESTGPDDLESFLNLKPVPKVREELKEDQSYGTVRNSGYRSRRAARTTNLNMGSEERTFLDETYAKVAGRNIPIEDIPKVLWSAYKHRFGKVLNLTLIETYVAKRTERKDSNFK